MLIIELLKGVSISHSSLQQKEILDVGEKHKKVSDIHQLAPDLQFTEVIILKEIRSVIHEKIF